LRRAYDVEIEILWKTRIYHPGRRDGIMGGMNFHEESWGIG
jgi:hypothetical protein